MAYDNLNKLSDGKLIDPQVLGEFIDVKLMDAIKFAPLCNVNRDLEGRPGSTLTLPKYAFIGYAEDVPEGENIPMAELAADTVDVPVKKAGKGVSISDEAILSAYGNPEDEIAKQLLMAIAGKVDNDCVKAFRQAKLTVPAPEAGFDKYVISDMIAQFGEDIEEEMVAMIHPTHLAILRRDPDFVQVMAGQKIIDGEVGQLFGARVVVSNKCAIRDEETNEITGYNVFLVKAGAVEILMKRNVAVEADRDIVNKTNVFVVDEHYAVYLRDESKVVKAEFPKAE